MTEISDVGIDQGRQSNTAMDIGRILDRPESIWGAEVGWRVEPKTDKMGSESGVRAMMKI